MKKLPLQFTVAVFSCVLLVLVLASIVFLPSCLDTFDFSQERKLNVSSVINNLFTPVISLVSVFLLYITLNKQIISITDQRLSKNLDLLLSLITNLENEFGSLTYNKKGTKTRGTQKTDYSDFYYGYDALTNFLPTVRSFPTKFGHQFFSEKVISIIYSYQVLVKTFNTLKIDDEIKKTLSIKINYFYLIKLRYPLILYAFNIKDNVDKHSLILLDFVIKQEKNINPNFDLKSYDSEGKIIDSIIRE